MHYSYPSTNIYQANTVKHTIMPNVKKHKLQLSVIYRNTGIIIIITVTHILS